MRKPRVDPELSWRKEERIKKAKKKALLRTRYIGPDSGSPFAKAIKARASVSRQAGVSRRVTGKCKPNWLTKEHKNQIQDVYRQADLLTYQTGVLHHVDHIVPLKGKTVSGLHVPWNLAPMKCSENISKGNRHWPDMWQ